LPFPDYNLEIRRFGTLRVVVYLAACGLFAMSLPATAADAATEDRKEPKPVKPPHEAVDQGFRMSFIVGISGQVMPARYSYSTRIDLPGGQQLTYANTQTAPGGYALGGFQLTPPRALRRFTAGIDFGAGGLASWLEAPIPNGVPTQFSRDNLLLAIQRRYIFRSGWHPSISPYIEHELGNVLGNRCRIGYQYWTQSGQYQGAFISNDGSRALAAYDVHLRYSAHLVRFSINTLTELDDTPLNSRRKQRFGLTQQFGLLVGTNRTLAVFWGVGPFWNF
jgi:hypothetical protein